MVLPIVKKFDDFAENMANPPTDRPLANAAAQFGRKVCDAISARPEIFAPTILQSPLIWACQPYWDGEGYDGPTGEIPFEGGQCDGQIYRPSGTYVVSCSTSGFPEGTVLNWQAGGNCIGPVTGIGKDEEGQGWVVLHAGAAKISLASVEFSGNIQVIPRPGVICSQANLSTQRRSANTPPAIVAMNPQGFTDNCGNPAPIPIPGPNPAPDPGPLPPGTGPSFDIRGNPIIIFPPTLEIAPDITVELSPGEFDFGGGTGGGPAEPPIAGDPIEGDGGGTGGGENDFGEPPDGERWAGCCVKITESPIGWGVIPQSVPNDVYPAIAGNIRLRFAAGSAGSDYDTPIRAQQETSCVWEPVRGLAPTGCFVNLLPGFDYTVIPYSVPLEQ